MSYATIPIFGEKSRLYRETRLAYMVSNKDNPYNHPIYVVDTKLGSFILYSDFCFEGEEQNDNQQPQIELILKHAIEDEALWTTNFGGVVSKEGVGACVWVKYPKKDAKLLSFKP